MDSKIQHSSAIPLHVQVEEILRKMATSPQYKEGNLFPSEIELTQSLNVSRNTVRHAMKQLISDGILLRKKGFGTRVVTESLVIRLEHWKSFTLAMKDIGYDFKTFAIKAAFEKINDELANLFKLSKDSEVLKVERLKGMKDGPMVLFQTYFHPQTGLTGTEDFSVPFHQLIEKHCSQRLVLASEEILAQPAGQYISQQLEIKRTDPVLVRRRKIYDQQNRLFQYCIDFYRSDKFSYHLDLNN